MISGGVDVNYFAYILLILKAKFGDDPLIKLMKSFEKLSVFTNLLFNRDIAGVVSN